MNKNRILSLILSVMMLFTLVFQTGVYAEEIESQDNESQIEEIVTFVEEQPVEEQPVEEQPVEEQPVEEQPVEEQPVEEQPVEEQPVEEQLVEEQPAEDDELPFVQGYVRVNAGTTVYTAESKQEEKGTFSSDAVVYAKVSTRAANEAYTWLWIVFDTVEVKEVSDSLLSGYVQFKDVSILSDESVEQLNESLKNANEVRSFEEKLIPVVPFVRKNPVEIDVTVEETVDEIVEVESALAGTGITITKQPESVTAPAGTKVTWTVEATGDNLSFQWQYHYAGATAWNAWGTGNEKTFSANVKFDGLVARCVITDASNNQVISDEVTLTIGEVIVEPEITITKQPESVTAPAGTKLTWTVEAAGNGLSYQWQYHYAGATAWNAWGTGNEKTFYANVKFDGLVARCVITDASNNQVISDEVTLTIGEVIVEPEITITKQPESVTAPAGTKVTWTVEATGNSLSYQWQYHYAGATAWNAWGTGNEKTFYANVKFDGLVARCVITDASNNQVISDEVTLTIGEVIVEPEITITKQPESVTAPAGSKVTWTVEATGDNLSYQWQYHYAGATVWNNWGTGNVKEFNANVRFDGLVARCVITDASNKQVVSDEVTLTIGEVIVEPEITITKQPESVTAPAGTKVTWTVEATGDNLLYQWQYHYAGATVWNNWGAGNVKTFTANEKFDGLVARCVITDASNKQVVSDEVTLTIGEVIVEPEITITKQPESVTAPAGTKVTLTVEATGNNLLYQWQYHYAGATAWNDWGTGNVKEFNANVRFDGLVARCVITDASNKQIISDEVTLTIGEVIVEPEITITKQPESVTAPAGTKVTWTVEATGDNLLYQWQYHYAGATVWNNWGAGNVKTFTANEKFDGLVARCVITDASNGQVISDEVMLTIGEVIVEPEITITKQPESVTAPAGTRVTWTVEATGNNLSYQWQYHYAGATAWNDWGTGNVKTFTANVKFDGLVARCVITDEANNQLISDEVTLTLGFTIDDVTYMYIDSNTIRVFRYSGTASSLIIPQEINGCTVTEIGEGAFEGNTSLRSISLPNSITVIRKRAFANCINLSEMTNHN